VEDRYLHRMAVKATKAVQTRVSKEPGFAAAAVRGLMGTSEIVNFDQATKTKTIEKIVADANSDALTEIIPVFEKLILNPGTTEEKAAASNRQFVAGLLLSIVRAKSATGNSDSEEDYQSVLEQILFIFVRFAYFMDSAPKPALSQATQELLRNRINSSLNSLLASQKYAATIPYAVVRQIRDGAKSQEHGKFIIDIDDKLQDSVKAAFKSLKKLSSKVCHLQLLPSILFSANTILQEKKGETSSIAAFKLLYSLTVLQVYSGDADAVSMLDELEFCYTKFLGEDSKTKDTSDASDALVEILLSFASKQSQLFRRMSEQVFGAFADQVTENGLESLISVRPKHLHNHCSWSNPSCRFWKPRRAWLVNRRCSKSRMMTMTRKRTTTKTTLR
jgi:DNA polymerase phi